MGSSQAEYDAYVEQTKNIQDDLRPHSMAPYTLFGVICGVILCMGNLMYNWNPTRKAMLESGIFEWLCSNDDVPTDSGASCKEQDDALNRLYTLGLVFVYLSAGLSGLILDYVGTRPTFLLGGFLQIAGYACWYFGTKYTRGLFYLGSVVMGLSNECCFSAFYSTCFLFTNRTSTMIGIIGAFRSLCFCKSIFFEMLVRNESFYTSLWLLIAVCAGGMAVGYNMIPTKNYPKIETMANYERIKKEERVRKQLNIKSSIVKEAFKVLSRLDVLLYCIYLSTGSFRMSMWNSVASTLLLDDSVMYLMYWAVPVSGVFTPLIGYIADVTHPLVAPFIINTFLILMYFVQVAFGQSTASGWACVVIYMIGQSFLAGQAYVVFQNMYDFKNFGILCGICGVVQACFLPVVQPVYERVSGNPDRLQHLLVGLMCLGIGAYFILALYWYLYHRYQSKTLKTYTSTCSCSMYSTDSISAHEEYPRHGSI